MNHKRKQCPIVCSSQPPSQMRCIQTILIYFHSELISYFTVKFTLTSRAFHDMQNFLKSLSHFERIGSNLSLKVLSLSPSRKLCSRGRRRKDPGNEVGWEGVYSINVGKKPIMGASISHTYPWRQPFPA